MTKDNSQNNKDLDTSTSMPALFSISEIDRLFLLAAKQGDKEFINQSLAQGMPFDQLKNIIHAQGCVCHPDTVTYLLSLHNTTDPYRNTVLHTEAKKGNVFSFMRFLDFYKNAPSLHQYKAIMANLAIKNNAGETVFHLLANEDHRLFLQVILDQLKKRTAQLGINPNQDINSLLQIENNDKCTVMDIAAIKGYKAFIKLLLPYAKRYTCRVCPRSFSSLNALIIHKSIHIRTRPYKCLLCPESFSTLRGLSTHERIHTKENSKKELYKCNLCGASFSTPSGFNTHQRIHTGERPYQCVLCGKVFKRKEHLKYHMYTHINKKLAKCPVCGIELAQKSSLKVHMTTHTGERPYKCNKCNTAFTQICNLKTHEKIHLRLECVPCGISFTDALALQAHEQAIHTNQLFNQPHGLVCVEME